MTQSRNACSRLSLAAGTPVALTCLALALLPGCDLQIDLSALGGVAEPHAENWQVDRDGLGQDTGPGADLAAHDGRWLYTDIREGQGDCAAAAELLPLDIGSPFYVDRSNDGGFRKEFPGLDVTSPCSVNSDLSFACGTVSGTMADPALDVAMPGSLTTTGVVEDELHMHGSYLVEVDCEGGGCGAVQDSLQVAFPCAVELHWWAAHETAT